LPHHHACHVHHVPGDIMILTFQKSIHSLYIGLIFFSRMLRIYIYFPTFKQTLI
jgi:hypothetical protein